MINKKQFENPDAKYRPAPFWSWNHELVPERLTEQIRSMHEQGLGGYYMHSRGGLKTEYLGEDWAKAIDACIQEGIRLGMFACLYDEDTWPSGYAAGMVTKDRLEFAAQYMVLRDDGTIELTESQNSPRWGTPPPDTMSKEAMAHYIKITHEWYKERFGKHFGKDFSGAVPTIFGDEPNISNINGRQGIKAIPWSRHLRAEFEKRKGYNMEEKLNEMFFDLPGHEKVRFDFFDVATALFREAFTEQIYDWCEANNIDFTCHYWEHMYPNTTMQGDVMAHYDRLQIPGIDMLFNTPEELEREQFGFDLIVKELHSAAVQTGKRRIMSETHGGGGWDVTFRDQKRMLDWQFALGINYVIPHLFQLSLEGDRKRDYPLSFIHEPWWGEYRFLADYIARLCYLLSEGDFVADTLVLHNYTSTFAAFSTTNSDRLQEIGENMRNSVKALSAGQVYYNMGSEILLERYAKAENGKITIGGMKYGYLVIPSAIMILPQTLKLIEEFRAQGGVVVSTGEKPPELADIPTTAIENIAGWLKERGAAGLSPGINFKKLYAHERLIDGKKLLFMCNISLDETAEFELPLNGKLTEYNCETGTITDIAYDGKSKKISIPPCGSVCYVIDENAEALRPSKGAAEVILSKCKNFKITRQADNMLAINSCQVKLDDGWEESGTAVAVNDKLRAYAFGEGSPYTRRQPWMFTAEDKAKKAGLTARYTFKVDGNITRLRIAAEYPNDFTVKLNGVQLKKDGHFIDRDIASYPAAASAVKQGENVIELQGIMHINTTVESVYVIGDFYVDDYVLKTDKMPGMGDASKQGHPFYCGAVSYETEIDVKKQGKASVRLEGFRGAAAKVFVNGKACAVLGWEPFEADISGLAVEGKNVIRVDVYSSGQNIFGPHAKLQMPGLVSPSSFTLADDGVFFGYGLDGVTYVSG